MSGPPIEHECAPQERPRHGPQPAQPSSHRQSSRPLKRGLHNDADAHEEEEPSGSAEFRPISDPPQAQIMDEGGHGERAYDRARKSKERAARTRAKNDEKVSEELVPAEAPELADRGGEPGPVRDARPLRGRLAKEDPPDQRCDVV